MTQIREIVRGSPDVRTPRGRAKATLASTQVTPPGIISAAKYKEESWVEESYCYWESAKATGAPGYYPTAPQRRTKSRARLAKRTERETMRETQLTGRREHSYAYPRT